MYNIFELIKLVLDDFCWLTLTKHFLQRKRVNVVPLCSLKVVSWHQSVNY